MTAIAIGGVAYFVNVPIEYDINTMEEIKDYYICNRCKAGIKRKHEYIASALEGIENVLFVDKDISFKPYADYLSSIEEMGKWYVEHIATYETKIDEIVTKSAKEYYKSNKIERRGNIYLYPCDNLKSYAGEYIKAGDDCVRFLFSCLNNMDNNFIICNGEKFNRVYRYIGNN